MPEQKQFKRAPALYKKISDINPTTDIRIRLLGRVIGKRDGIIVLDDGNERIDVVADEIQAETNDILRVFARVLPLESGFELRAELAQKMEELDLDSYEKVFFQNSKRK